MNIMLGDPALLHLLIRDKNIDMSKLREMDAGTLKAHCHACGIKTAQKSQVNISMALFLFWRVTSLVLFLP